MGSKHTELLCRDFTCSVAAALPTWCHSSGDLKVLLILAPKDPSTLLLNPCLATSTVSALPRKHLCGLALHVGIVCLFCYHNQLLQADGSWAQVSPRITPASSPTSLGDMKSAPRSGNGKKRPPRPLRPPPSTQGGRKPGWVGPPRGRGGAGETGWPRSRAWLCRFLEVCSVPSALRKMSLGAPL